MAENEVICPKCGYKNREPRARCKNCGEALYAWAETRVAKRKKPLLQLIDVILGLLGLAILLITPMLAKIFMGLVNAHSWKSLLSLAMILGFMYMGLIFLILPLYYLFLYLLGHDVITGRVNDKYIKGPNSDDPEYIVRVSFTPEHARDSRSRLLTCRVYKNRFRENDDVIVHYALRNPDIMIIEGE